MATPNPTLLNQSTRFRPASSRAQSRSPSRSPIRKAQFTAQEIDPLLGNLSPTTTLEALSYTEVLRTSQSQNADILARSIAETSTDERAYGIKAALAAQKLREWHTEVQGWKWPARKDRKLGKGFQPRQDSAAPGKTSGPNPKHKEYVGSLPRAVVAQHEERIEQIKDGLEALDVEELKEHVLSAHNPSRSKASSPTVQQKGVVQISDFTAVITHTMLQALPCLSKLTILLQDWDVRILVLKHIPRLLRRLEEAELDLQSASDRVCARRTSGLFTRAHFEKAKAALEQDVSLLGASFDKLLDLLEGREDSLPETWIDRMDKIEAQFAQWTIEAERRVLYNEWMEQSRMSKLEQNSVTDVGGSPTTDRFSSRQSGQPSGSKNLQDGTKNHESNETKPDHSKVMGVSLTNQQLRREDTAVAADVAPVLPISSTLSAVPPISPRRERQHRTSKEEPQPVLHPLVSPDLAAPSRRSLDLRQEVLNMLQEQDSSAAIPKSPPKHKIAVPSAYSKEQDERPEAATSAHTVASPIIAKESLFLRRTSRSGAGVPVSEPLNIHQGLPPDQHGSSLISGPQIKQSLTLNLPPANHHREVSDVSLVGSTVSEAFSDISNAEIVDATTAESLGSPKIVRHSVRASHDLSNSFVPPEPQIQSLDFPGQNMPLPGAAHNATREAASMSFDNFHLPIKTSDTVADDGDGGGSPQLAGDQLSHDAVPSDPSVMHRASVSSVEKVPKSRIRSIVVGRRDSSSSSVASPVSPLDTAMSYARSGSAKSVSPLENASSVSLDKKCSRKDYFEAAGRRDESPSLRDGAVLPPVVNDPTATPSIPRRSSMRLSRRSSPNLKATWSTTNRDVGGDPVNSFHESPDVRSVVQSWAAGPTPARTDDNTAIKTPSKGKAKAQEDLLESKIQNLLTRIPARIRLLSESESESPPHPPTASSSRSQSPIPSIILSPVKQRRRLQANHNSTPNSDVRTFHLTRSTDAHNTPPIKLFVRLVGEHGERVMVRVGGGWADLGDYLRDYSLHHSTRGLNNGHFELASLPLSGQKDSKDRRVIPLDAELISKATTSAPVSHKSKSPANSRPGSAMDHRPSAVTPFGVLRPTRRRRSTSAAATQDPDTQQDSTSSSIGYTSPSYTSNINNDTYYDTPPVPTIPQIRTLNPYFGGDPRSSDPSQPQSGAVALSSPSSYSALTPTPPANQARERFVPTTTSMTTSTKMTTTTTTTATASSHPHHDMNHQQEPPRTTTSTSTSTSPPHHNLPLTTTRTRRHPTTPAARGIAIHPSTTTSISTSFQHDAQESAPAPTIGGDGYSFTNGLGGDSKPMTLKSSSSLATSRSISGVGDKGAPERKEEKREREGGIRRVFFRRKGSGGGA